MIGRRSELATLTSALERARRGLGSAVFVTGEPGMGKTTLVTAAIEGVDQPSLQTAWGSGWEAGGSPALWPWIQVLRRLGAPPELMARVAGAESPMGDDADPDGRRVRMFDDVCEFLPDVGRDLGTDVDLGTDAELGTDPDRPTGADRNAVSGAGSDAHAGMELGGRVRVIVLEDVHWADAGTLTLLELIGSRVRDRRVLLIAT